MLFFFWIVILYIHNHVYLHPGLHPSAPRHVERPALLQRCRSVLFLGRFFSEKWGEIIDQNLSCSSSLVVFETQSLNPFHTIFF